MTPVETSAIVAVLLDEEDAENIRDAIVTAENPITLTSNVIEAGIAIGRHIRDYEIADRLVQEFCDIAGIRVLPLTLDHVSTAIRAYGRYGKGSGHRAGLNFGDCLSYSLAKQCSCQLIYKGNDFNKTDIVRDV